MAKTPNRTRSARTARDRARQRARQRSSATRARRQTPRPEVVTPNHRRAWVAGAIVAIVAVAAGSVLWATQPGSDPRQAAAETAALVVSDLQRSFGADGSISSSGGRPEVRDGRYIDRRWLSVTQAPEASCTRLGQSAGDGPVACQKTTETDGVQAVIAVRRSGTVKGAPEPAEGSSLVVATVTADI